jgi:hypothetical protein
MTVYRLQNGTIAKATFEASTTNIVKNFPDMQGIARWTVAEPRIVTPYVVRERTLGGQVKGNGLNTFKWRIAILNDDMFDYLYNTVLGGAMSANVTVMTRNRLTATKWLSLWAVCTIAELTPDGLNPRFNGVYFSPVELTFTGGEYAS